MLAKTTLDAGHQARPAAEGSALPITARTEAEISAERRWGIEWRSKRLNAHFAAMIEPDAADDPRHVCDRFARWLVMLTQPGRERKAAERLERVHAVIYLPQFSKQMKCRGRMHANRLFAVVPGMLFAPSEILEIERRDETLEWAGVRDFIRDGYGHPALATKADIERIRIMEALLNLPPEAKGVLFKLGQRVRFTNDLWQGWGAGRIFEIASETRIGVEVEKLFGRPAKIYVAASEIEAM
jgi:hypothetical protein